MGCTASKETKEVTKKMVEVQDKTYISVGELAELDKKNLSILDCSVIIGEGEDPVLSYLKEHIEGAKFLDLKLARDLQSPYPFMMPSQEYFCLIAKSLDIRKTRTVVVYDC